MRIVADARLTPVAVAERSTTIRYLMRQLENCKLSRYGTLVATTAMLAAAITAIAQEGELAFDPPVEWMQNSVSSPMRLAQFTLPRADGDIEDAELVIFYFGGSGGTVEANLQRWTSQMIQPDGQPSAEVATTTSFTINKDEEALPVTLLDVPGIYAAAVRPGSGMRYHKPNFRLKAAVVETPAGPYFFKLTGPDRTVLAWNDQFGTFLESVRFQ